MRHALLTMVLLLSPVEPVVWRVSLRAEVVAGLNGVVTFDSTGDGARDDWREGCRVTIDETGALTATCPPTGAP